MTIRILLVDDHPLVVDGLQSALAQEPDLNVKAVAGSIAAARKALEEPLDVVICDVRLGDGSGFELLKESRSTDNGPVFLMLSSFDAPQYVDAALRLGAAGFVVKTSPAEEIIAAVRRVRAGGVWFDSRVESSKRRPPTLTPRERDVVAAVVRGRSNDEIAADLSISRKTVEAHLSKLYARTGAVTRTELAILAERGGWLEVL